MTKPRLIADSANANSIDGDRLVDGSVSSEKIAGIQSSKLSYTYPGGEARTVDSRLNDLVSVMDFIPESERAAVRDGTSTFNCSPSVQDAMDASKGGIFFPPGTYNMEGPVYLPKYSFYSGDGGYTVTGQNCDIIVKNPAGTALFTTTGSTNPNPNDEYSSRWRFNNLSFTGAGTGGSVFDLDRIYNSVISHNSFVSIGGAGHVFISEQDKGASHPQGYIQSCYIAYNHFGGCRVLQAKIAYNLTFSNNFLEGCSKGVWIDGFNDPAFNGGRICDNVMEGGGAIMIKLGGCLGVIISGNYFENNPFVDRYIDLAVPGAALHRGLVISGNSFRPSPSQKTDPNFFAIKIANYIKGIGSPVVLGNASQGQLISGLQSNALFHGNVEIGASNFLNYAHASQTYAIFSGIGEDDTLGNRSTAYDSGSNTWKVFRLGKIDRSTIYEVDGFLNISNVGLELIGRTMISMKFFVHLQSPVTIQMIGSLTLEELAGTKGNGNPFATNYWGLVSPSFSYDPTTQFVTVSFNAFNDVNTPVYGLVHSLRPDLTVRGLGKGGDYIYPEVRTDF
jgi:hypothetical protein